MHQTSFRDVVATSSRSLCDCVVKKGMTLEEALTAICNLYTPIFKEINLEQVNFKELGITETCKFTYMNLLTEVINALIQKDIDFSLAVASIAKAVSNITTTVATAPAEKVKVNAADPTAGYLEEKITSPQPGAITTINNKISFMGFVPIGTVLMVNKSRLPDFDATGKGKAATDLWGFAICNGNNGTINRLDKMARYVKDPADGGKVAGTDTVTLKDVNIPSLTIPVNGTISDGLATPVRAATSFDYKGMDNDFGNVSLLSATPNGSGAITHYSAPMDLHHTHSFSLQAKSTNPMPTAISLLPLHILEIPIERITV